MQADSDSGIQRERRILELQCVPLCSNEEMGRKELSPRYPPLGQPKGPLTQGAKRAHYQLHPLASSPPDDTLRELCPHSNRPESGGQKLPWEKYLIPLSHTCSVINPNTGVYSGCIFKLHKGSRERKEANFPEPMKKSSDSFLSYNRPEFISPNFLQGLVFQVTVGFQSSTHITYLNQREFSKAQISSIQVSFPNCLQTDFSKTYTHLFHKHIYSCYQVE